MPGKWKLNKKNRFIFSLDTCFNKTTQKIPLRKNISVTHNAMTITAKLLGSDFYFHKGIGKLEQMSIIPSFFFLSLLSHTLSVTSISCFNPAYFFFESFHKNIFIWKKYHIFMKCFGCIGTKKKNCFNINVFHFSKLNSTILFIWIISTVFAI